MVFGKRLPVPHPPKGTTIGRILISLFRAHAFPLREQSILDY